MPNHDAVVRPPPDATKSEPAGAERSDILADMSPRAQYHHGNLKEALVDAARDLLGEHGAYGISLRKVAKTAGVSQAAPYHHFDNKEALLAEVARRGFDQLVSQIRAVPDEDPRENLREMGRVYIAFGLANPEVYQLMFGAEFCPAEEHAELKESAGAAFGHLAQVVGAGCEAGVFRGEPVGMSMAVWSAMHGVVSLLQNRVHEGKEMQGQIISQEAVIQATIDLVSAGLTAG